MALEFGVLGSRKADSGLCVVVCLRKVSGWNGGDHATPSIERID